MSAADAPTIAYVMKDPVPEADGVLRAYVQDPDDPPGFYRGILLPASLMGKVRKGDAVHYHKRLTGTEFVVHSKRGG